MPLLPDQVPNGSPVQVCFVGGRDLGEQIEAWLSHNVAYEEISRCETLAGSTATFRLKTKRKVIRGRSHR